MVNKIFGIFLLLAAQVAPAPRPSPELAGIAHVALRVTDVAKSREFYQTLGFEEAFAFPDPGKAPVSYLKVNDRQFIELYQRSDPSQPLGLMHVCYEATDINALHEYYLAQGINVPPARKARAGNLLFVFHDPEDQVVEFTQYMPGSLHDQARGKHLGERRVSQHMIRATIPVKDVEAERSFYSSKLGFDDRDGKGAAQLRLAGSLGQAIELQAGPPTRLTFGVADLSRASSDLQSRGLTIHKNHNSVSVADPDRAVIVFDLVDKTGIPK